MEALLIWNACGCVHRPQESLVRVHAAGVESTSVEMFGVSKDYDMNFHYHRIKANVIADALSRMSMGITTHIEDEKKELAKDVHRLARLGERLVDSPSGGFSVRPRYESSLVVEVKKGQHLYLGLM